MQCDVLFDEKGMAGVIHIDHLWLPAYDCDASARFLSRVLDLPYSGLNARGLAELRLSPIFMLVYVKSDAPKSMHAGFHVSEAVVSHAKRQLDLLGVTYSGDPEAADSMSDDHIFGGKGFYFSDPNGHLLEIFTVREQL